MRSALRFTAGRYFSHMALTLGAVGLLATGFVASGCGEEDLAGGGLTASESALGTEFALDIPGMAELNSRLNLTPEQNTQMEKILADWRADAGERMTKRAERRAEHRAGKKGTREMARPMDAPGFDHLADAAAVLDNDQLATFATFIKERREARRADRKGQADDETSMGPMARQMARHMGVSSEEMKQVRSVHRESADRMRDLHTQYAAGSISAETLRDGLRAIRLDTEGRMKSTLGETDFNRLHERRGAMKEKALDRRAESLELRATKQAERLGRALRLDEAGMARLAGAMEQTLPARRQLIEQMSKEEMAPEDVVYEGIQIEKNASAAIRSVLSPEEAVRFDSLKRLLPAGAGVHGAGPGRGHGIHHGHN